MAFGFVDYGQKKSAVSYDESISVLFDICMFFYTLNLESIRAWLPLPEKREVPISMEKRFSHQTMGVGKLVELNSNLVY